MNKEEYSEYPLYVTRPMLELFDVSTEERGRNLTIDTPVEFEPLVALVHYLSAEAGRLAGISPVVVLEDLITMYKEKQ